MYNTGATGQERAREIKNVTVTMQVTVITLILGEVTQKFGLRKLILVIILIVTDQRVS